MSNHRPSHGRLTTIAGLLALVFAGTAAAGGTGAATSPASTASACHADARIPASARGNHCPADAAPSYTYRTLDYPGSSSTIFWGLNDFGELSGQYTLPGGVAHAMAYRHGRFEALDPALLGTYFSAAGGPDDAGTTFGGYADATGRQHGFVLHGRHLETVDFQGHLNSNVDGLNRYGAIAGVYWDADGVFHGVLHRGHRFDTPIDFPGARDTYPLGISASGEVVGYWDVDPRLTHGFFRSADGQLSSIDVPGAASTAVFAINDVGQIAGYYADAAGIHGFVERHGQVGRLDVPGASVTIATAINNFGVVAGEYYDATGKRQGFIATPSFAAHPH